MNERVCTQQPVVARICAHLDTLQDVVALSRCSRLLYARVRQCFPELPIIGELWPTTLWYSLVKASMARVAFHPLTWRYVLSRFERHGCATNFIAHLFDVKAWPTLELLLGQVVHGMAREQAGHILPVPDPLWYWHYVVLEAIRHWDDAWVNRASKVLYDAFNAQGTYTKETWDDYRHWYISFCLPTVKQVSREVVEKGNAEFILELIAK